MGPGVRRRQLDRGGAEGHINGATTQADLYGIFGREGLDMAARWTTPDTASPTYKAMKIYRNYDGNTSTVGDVSVQTTSTSNPDSLSVFGAQRSGDNALTVMVINKVVVSAPVTVNLSNFAPSGTAQVYQLTSANAITRLTDIAVPASSVALTAPGPSITLLVLPASGGPVNQAPTAVASGNPTSGTAPLNVAFSAAGSSDPDGSIASYQWAFGDGTTGSGPTPAKVSSNAGSFIAILTVTDNQGATGTASVPIAVSPAPAPPATPTALSASASSRTVTLHWTDTSSNQSGFYIERAVKGKNPAFTRAGEVGAGVTTFVQRVPANTWIYRVQASNANGVSGYSNQATIRVR